MPAKVKWTVALLMLLAASSCMLHRSSPQRLLDTARELNISSRFGRMDVAAGHAAPKVRAAFLERRALWGNDVRIVDIGVGNINLEQDDMAATVDVQVSWTRMSEGTLRLTRVQQHWVNAVEGGWLLEREERGSGDFGLFGDAAPAVERKPPRDTHFPTKTISSR